MSDYEEETFCFYGKALEQYDEDSIPKKKPISVEDQIATDSNGRRRFHGAFTGGFSAGFFNTVGSLEGWTPSEFKSSRSEKQKHVVMNPEDFMDDEDMGEFGFAPQTIKATKDYDTSKKRKKKVFSDGPIPGDPVLHTLFTSGNETVGYMLLKNIGLGEKIKARDEEIKSSSKIYGCEMPKSLPEIPKSLRDKDYQIPDIYKEFFQTPKINTFGLGYVGLDKTHLNLFKSPDLVVHEKNKKLLIRGQAFGVGAFEQDDEDIYAKEDMSNYDFELTKEKDKKIKQLKDTEILGMFNKAKSNTLERETHPPPVIPKSFTGKHKVKKSRFEPLDVLQTTENIERKNIDANSRAELLGEEINQNATISKKTVPETKPGNKSKNTENVVKKFDPSSLWDDRFISASQKDESENILAPVEKYEHDHYGKEMKDAARMKLFGPLTRISQDWQPCSLLCKRFNVPEPFNDKPNTLKNRTKTKNLMFEYQKHHEENVLKPGLNQQTIPEINSLEIKQEIPEINERNINESIEEATNGETEEKVEDKIIDITDRLNIEDKIDLFKAVFSDSEDEEPEENIEQTKAKEKEEMEKFKTKVLSDELVLPKIKPVKTGIFSGLDLKSIQSNKTNPVEIPDVQKVTESVENYISDDSYGPKLPDKIITKETSSLNTGNNESSCDEWVEKDDADVVDSKKRKHKKQKSHKKKHHKSKKSKK